MKYPADQDAVLLDAIKDHVLSLLDAPKPGMNPFAGAADTRSLSNHVKAVHKIAEIAFRLLLAPGVDGVQKNAFEIRFRFVGKVVSLQAVRLRFALARSRIAFRSLPITSPSAMPLSNPS